MRSRALFLTAAFFFVALALPQISHASIPFFGPIIPQGGGQATCPLGWGAVINVINRTIELALTLAIVFVAPLMIAYAGFLMVVSPVSPSGVSRARSLLLNTVVGIVIALAAWLIVDAVLVAFTNQGVAGWTALIGGQGLPPCLNQAGVAPAPSAPTAVSPGVTAAAPFLPTLSPAQIQERATAAKAYESQVCAAAAAQGIPTQCAQLLGIVGIESDGNPNIVGPLTSKGESIGLMQLQPTTAAANGVAACAGSSNISPSSACVAALQDPATNISAGTRLYAKLYNEFNGDATNAIAAYNAGDGTGVNSDGTKQAFAPSSDCPGLYAWQCIINPGGLLETQQYVGNVSAVATATGV